MPLTRITSILTVEALGRGAQVYIDALDVLAEDYGTMQGAVGLVKSILKALSDLKGNSRSLLGDRLKYRSRASSRELIFHCSLSAPSRLTLLLPSNSTLLAHLLPPSLSPTITTLTLHPPSLISHLSHQHLIIPSIPGEGPPGSGERFWEVLRKAGEGEVAVEMALSGEGGLEVGHWSKVHVSSGSGSGVYLVGFGGGPSSVKGKGKMIGGAGVGGYSEGSGVIVEILVRKAQGGAGKGMSRSLEGLRHVSVFVGSKGKEKMSQEMEVAEGRLECCRWEEVRGMEMVGRKFGSGREEVETQGSSEAEQVGNCSHIAKVRIHILTISCSKLTGCFFFRQSSNSSHPSQAHIPFNLSLTSSQQASRAEVPIPYAHEGEEATSTSAGGGAAGATIYFEPGSDDDMDEDDPDEDLDF